MTMDSFEDAYQRIAYAKVPERVRLRSLAVQDVVKGVAAPQVRELLRLAMTGTSDSARDQIYEYVRRRDPSGHHKVGFGELQLLAHAALGLLLAKSTKGAALAALSIASASGPGGVTSGWRSVALERHASAVQRARGDGLSALNHLDALPDLVDKVRDGSRKEDRERLATRAKRAVASATLALRAEEEERRLRAWAMRTQLPDVNLAALSEVVGRLVSSLELLPVDIGLVKAVLDQALTAHAEASIGLQSLDAAEHPLSRAAHMEIEWMLPLHCVLGGRSPGPAAQLSVPRVANQLAVELVSLAAWERALA